MEAFMSSTITTFKEKVTGYLPFHSKDKIDDGVKHGNSLLPAGYSVGQAAEDLTIAGTGSYELGVLDKGLENKAMLKKAEKEYLSLVKELQDYKNGKKDSSERDRRDFLARLANYMFAGSMLGTLGVLSTGGIIEEFYHLPPGAMDAIILCVLASGFILMPAAYVLNRLAYR
jgi:hypothetical protein